MEHLGPFEMKADPSICTSLFLEKEEKILLGLRHYKLDKFKDVSLWTTPGGRCNKEEKIGENLIRETVEETGINEIQVRKFLGTVPGAKEGDILYVFWGNTDQEPALMEPEKFSQWRWFSLEEVPENFINPAALQLFRTKKQLV